MNFRVYVQKLSIAKTKPKDLTSVDVKVSELQCKTGIIEEEKKLLKESSSNKQKLLEVVL